MSGAPAGGAGGGGGLGAGGGGVGAGGASAGGAGGLGGLGGLAGGNVLPILIAGGLSGVLIMGALIGTGILPVHQTRGGSTPGRLALVACPDTGPVLAIADPGQKFLVTGRNGDGSWLQVYVPGPALPYAWAPASELNVTGDTSGLPVTACEVAAASPVGTSEVTATPIESPIESAAPTPTPTPTPTAKANQGPVLSNLGASHSTIYYPWVLGAAGCSTDSQNPIAAKISVKATDPDGVAGVTLFYRLPGAALKSVAMAHGGSTYSSTVGLPAGANTAGSLAYYVVAKDKNAKPVETTSVTKAVTVRKCDLPPKFTDFNVFTFQPNNNIFVLRKGSYAVGGDPHCSASPDASNYVHVMGAANDSDGTVASMKFFYRSYVGPGSVLKSINLTGSGGNMTGDLYRKDFTTLPNKNGGQYSVTGYFVAYDNLGHHSAHYADGFFTFYEWSCAP